MNQSFSPKNGTQLAQLLVAEGISNQSVLNAIARTPRQAFMPEAFAHKAFENTALPISKGQTISQPAIVARMTEILLSHTANPKKILEIGTGSGYQSAILAQLFDQVFSVERIKSLQFQAKRVLNQLDLYNVQMKHGDGWKGWSSKSPFDAIIVTAAASSVPQALLDQLGEGGVLVIPVGTDEQKLKAITRVGDEFKTELIANVKFVPLVAGDIE